MYSIVKYKKHGYYSGKYEETQIVKTGDLKIYLETILKEWFSNFTNNREELIQDKLNEIIYKNYGYLYIPNIGGREIEIENNFKIWTPNAHTD